MSLKSGSTIYTVEHIRSGQPRPHADSVYESIITVTWNTYQKGHEDKFIPRNYTDDTIIKIAKGLLGGFKTKSENPEWHEKILTEFIKINEGKWRFIITQ